MPNFMRALELFQRNIKSLGVFPIIGSEHEHVLSRQTWITLLGINSRESETCLEIFIKEGEALFAVLLTDQSKISTNFMISLSKITRKSHQCLIRICSSGWPIMQSTIPILLPDQCLMRWASRKFRWSKKAIEDFIRNNVSNRQKKKTFILKS